MRVRQFTGNVIHSLDMSISSTPLGGAAQSRAAGCERKVVTTWETGRRGQRGSRGVSVSVPFYSSFRIYVSYCPLIEMTESGGERASKPAKELLALNLEQESEFKKKVQEAKKKKRSGKVGQPCFHKTHRKVTKSD